MKKYRVRWDRIALLLVGIAVCSIIIYYIVTGLISTVRWCMSLMADDSSSKTERVEVISVTPQQLKESERMTARIDSMMHIPMRLDTSKIAVSVYDLTTSQDIYNFHDRQLLPPASCMKIATAIAGLRRLGLDYGFRVSLLKRGEMRGDTLYGSLLFKADDDPLFEDFADMARKLRQSGVRNVKGNLFLSLARVDTLRAHPSAKVWDIPFNRTPPLLKGQRHVERQLRYALSAAGITFKSDPTVRPSGRYEYVAKTFHRLTDVVTPMMIHSSNIKADALLYHLDYKRGLQRQRMDWRVKHDTETFWQEVFANDSTGVMRGFVFNDGSGLSPDNRLTARFLNDMLRYAYADHRLRDYLIKEALATPGDGARRGSLLTRMSKPEYRDRIFCKTGTMTTKGGSSLAGYIHSYDGHWYAFSIINTDSPVAESRIFQDKLCTMMIKAR